MQWTPGSSVLPAMEKNLNIIISFTGLKNEHNGTPYPLRHIASSTVLGHILVHILDLPFNQLILIVSSGEEQVQKWVGDHLPDLTSRMVLARNAANPVEALNECQNLLDAQPLLFISGNYISEANYQSLTGYSAAASCLVQSEQDNIEAEELRIDSLGRVTETGELVVRWAGACWFERGTDVVRALEMSENGPVQGIRTILSTLQAFAPHVLSQRTAYCLDTRSPDSMLYANARLLRLNYGSQDAIERSYAEDFTVLPPVYLHETAVIENSVIGPFVNLEANATIRNSIVCNSLVGKGTLVSDAILENSLIGDDAAIFGRRSTLIAGDKAHITIENKQISDAV